MLEEKRLPPSQCFKKQRQEGKTQILVENLQSATLYKFSLELVLSLYMSLRFWYKSKSLRSILSVNESKSESQTKSMGDPSLSLYCASCPSIETNRCLHSDISAHIQESNMGGVW
ncbi:hypothetical protein E3U43_020112 [Larimichthys crocea]|uniref:Uncharacterized protein n=1 Tax=Larimichthys crocea TaxID=215358 RepID=A0ACD3QXC6_LARCR|nr:hypothetical protein E3U43_020112 [Larimichthys crocea]